MPSEPGLTRPTRVHPASTAAYPPPNLAEPLPCPRCNSTITKFCYYNNYNLGQPRYFCKCCRRYWTHGGTLRDVPVGGGTRKGSSKRHRSFSSTTSASSSSTTSSSVVSTTQQTEETAKTEETTAKGNDVISGFGSFAALLGGGGQSEGAFLALGSGNGEMGYGSGFGFGYGFGEMGVGYSGGGEIPLGNGGGDTWQIGEIEGRNSGNSLIWPGLEMSMQQSNNV